MTFVTLSVELFDELNKTGLLRAVVDHCFQGLVVGGFVDLHVALLMDSLQSCVLSVVDHKHHDTRFIDQNLKSLQGELVREVVDVEDLLLVVGFLLGSEGCIVAELLVQALDHVLWVNKGAQMEGSFVDVNAEELKSTGSKYFYDELLHKVEITGA